MDDYLSTDYKAYITVNCDHMASGKIIPRSFVWEDGRHFDIDKVTDIRPAASLKAGGAGLRYTVIINNIPAFMYLEEDRKVTRWFMERKKGKPP